MMTGFALKLLAILSMLIDHIGYVLIPTSSPWYLACRLIGRLAFPIFCFLLSEGLIHTRSRPQYLLRLLIFAFISEIPFDLAFHGQWLSWSGQNVLFTFLFAAVGITVYEDPGLVTRLFSRRDGETPQPANPADALVRIFVLAACVGLAMLCSTDYSWMGVCLVYVFYFAARLGKGKRLAAAAVAMVLFGLFASLSTNSSGAIVFHFFSLGMWMTACISLALIAGYNGSRGPRVKWLFYVFYPGHLLVLWLISYLGVFA